MTPFNPPAISPCHVAQSAPFEDPYSVYHDPLALHDPFSSLPPELSPGGLFLYEPFNDIFSGGGFPSGLAPPSGQHPGFPGELSPGLAPPSGQFPEVEALRQHDRYSDVIRAVIDCTKVGASENELRSLDALRRRHVTDSQGQGGSVKDPELDKLMEVTCQQLSALRVQLQQPFDAAREYCAQVERRLAALVGGGATKKQREALKKSPSLRHPRDDKADRPDSDDLVVLAMAADLDVLKGKDWDGLKKLLTERHGSAIARRDPNIWKKEKTERLPSDAVDVMLDWWENGKKKPSVLERQELAAEIGLERTQVDNWFSNKNKRTLPKNKRVPNPPAAKKGLKSQGRPKAKKKSRIVPVPAENVASEDGLMIDTSQWTQGVEMEGQMYMCDK